MSETCHSLWIGPRLGAVERACLRSVLAQGHKPTLWCYDRPEGIPEGVTVADAATILPRDSVIAHRSGSVALFANHFRYELQRRGLGFWLDSDVYLLSPLTGLPDHVFAWTDSDHINTAVLRLPPSCPMIAPLLEIFEEQHVPAWLPLRAKLPAWWRLKRTGRSGLSEMPWGSAGPLAFTWLARRTGLDALAMAPAVFYPMHWSRAAWIADPGIQLEEVVTPETRAVHLWNELIKGFKDASAPRGSFLSRLQAEGA
jgi:hypothetical protein